MNRTKTPPRVELQVQHTYQPVRDSETGNQIAQCTTCGHRWYGKGEARETCVRPSICSGCGLTPDECAASRVKCCPDCSHVHPVKPMTELPLSRFYVVETDNFGGDYPDESFVGPPLSEPAANAVAEVLNREAGPNSERYYKVVPLGYKLVPGFEP